MAFEEDTSSENLCRSGAAFLTHFDVAIGSDLEIRIPFSQYASRRTDPERLGNPRNGNRFVGAIPSPQAKNSLASSSPAPASSASSARNPPLKNPGTLANLLLMANRNVLRSPFLLLTV